MTPPLQVLSGHREQGTQEPPPVPDSHPAKGTCTLGSGKNRHGWDYRWILTRYHLSKATLLPSRMGAGGLGQPRRRWERQVNHHEDLASLNQNCFLGI